jgi:hypothetical protein
MTLTPMLNQGAIAIPSENCLHAVACHQIIHNVWQMGLSFGYRLCRSDTPARLRQAKLRTRFNRIENRWFDIRSIDRFGADAINFTASSGRYDDDPAGWFDQRYH